MADQLPVRFQQLFDLTQLGVAPTSIGFQTLSLQSEKYITVRDDSSVSIFDTSNPGPPQKRAVRVDSAMMHPTHSILSLKAQNLLQVHKIDGAQAERVASHQMTENVEFWKWISPTSIGIVTSTAVYHWNIESGNAPQLMFQRLPNLAAHQIINYQVNHDMTWMALVGIQQSGDRIIGHTQLYSAEKSVSQPLDACAASFGTRTAPGQPKPVTIFCFASRQTRENGTMFITEVGGSTGAQKVQVPVFFPDNTPNDFPLSVEISARYSVVYLITKEGYFHLYDSETGKRIILNQISADTLFISAPSTSNGGIITINKKGQVMSLTVNENTIIPYISNTMKDLTLAISLASRANLPGAESLFQQQFQQLIQTGQYAAAAKVAAESPKGVLRTAATLNLLKSLPGSGQSSPLLTYFTVLLEKGKLNEQETAELAIPLLQQGRKEHVETWLKDDKLFCSESFGDVLRPIDPRLALLVYERAKVHHKVVAMLAETGQYDLLIAYSKRENYTPNWMQLLQAIIARNPAAASAFAKMLITFEGGPLMDPNAAVDAFMINNNVMEVTSLLLDVLNKDNPAQANLQTRLLEINLKLAPRVADAIFQNKKFTHYDRARIAAAAEQAGLIHRAIEHYENLSDVKRLLSTAKGLTTDFLVGYFANMNTKDTLELLRELLKSNLSQNLEGVVAVCVRKTPPPTNETTAEQFQPLQPVRLFEEFGSIQGTYLYLKQVVSLYKASKDVVFKFIEAAAKVGVSQDVEAACRAYEYDPLAVRELLKEIKLPDQLSLVIVCDKYGYVDDLTHYLVRNNMLQFVENYVQNINPMNTPVVVGALLDEGVDESKIKSIINAVGHLCPVDKLVEEVEKRNRLKLLRPWLEARFNEGNREPSTHNALAKILIITNDERREQFLLTNQYYDSAVVGKFCEQNEPDLALVAYKRGGLHLDVINVTNQASMFKQQARYLVELQSPELWAHVLNETNPYRRQLIDNVVQNVLPETQNPTVVSNTVKAFMDADLPNELIELLDRIVLESSNTEFSKNKKLQNLLILTAIKSAPTRVMDYVNRLNEYDGEGIATVALQKGLLEEAFTMYKKLKKNLEAITVLVDNLKNLQRAQDFATKINEPAVWSKLGRAQLQEKKVADSIDSFLKADDPESFYLVIQTAKEAAEFDPLVKYLRMARKLKKEKIDTELAFALAHTNKLAEMEDFITSPNVAKIQEVADSCFNQGLYEAARICYSSVNNYKRLASTLIKLGQYGPAVEAARKAANIDTWKEVNKACVDAGEIRLAQVCGLNIIVYGEELDEIVQHYEVRGKVDELISLIESGLGLERAHQGMFTALAQLYSNYKPEKLKEHLNLFISRINIGKVCNTCRDNQQWNSLAYLFSHDNEHDKAIKVMMEHSVDAWDDVQFKDFISKVKNHDLYYDAIQFYLEQHPRRILDLLNVIREKVDPVRVVDRMKKLGSVPLIKGYLVSVQEKNLAPVNETLNQIYIEEEDFVALKDSIDSYDNFDSIALANSLEKSQSLEFRRIAAHLYASNKRFKQSIDLSKKDKLYQDAMKSASLSKDKEIAEELLRYFVEINSPHSFAACLYVCYDLIRPDVALELAWKNNLVDFVMPFIIQTFREYTTKIDSLSAAMRPPAAGDSPLPPYMMTPPPHGMAGPHFPPAGVHPPHMMTPPPPGMVPPGMAPPGMPPPGMMPPGMAPPGMHPPHMMTPPSQGPPQKHQGLQPPPKGSNFDPNDFSAFGDM